MRHVFLFFTLFFTILGKSQMKEPKNIILLIGDGMGLTQISAGLYSNNNKTSLESFSYIGLSKTHASNDLVTDSAASGTAMACGVKTYNGAIGVDPKNQPYESILEICNQMGYRTGLVATSSIVHATPASFYANVDSRSKYQEIALQLRNHQVDIFVGGGKKHFVKRDDQRNLLNEMKDYAHVTSLEAFNKNTSDKISFFTYDDEPPKLQDGRTPALDDIVTATLDKLSENNTPFFLMVESSQIDWGGHANEFDYVINEFLEFDRTIAKALTYAKNHKNTLVIVTADHETGGLSIKSKPSDKFQIIGDFNSLGHTATMVPVFAYGPGAEAFSGIYDNTAIFHKIHTAVK